jgi:hypothetical protein
MEWIICIYVFKEQFFYTSLLYLRTIGLSPLGKLATSAFYHQGLCPLPSYWSCTFYLWLWFLPGAVPSSLCLLPGAVASAWGFTSYPGTVPSPWGYSSSCRCALFLHGAVPTIRDWLCLLHWAVPSTRLHAFNGISCPHMSFSSWGFSATCQTDLLFYP